MNLYVILVLTVLLAMSQQHIATAQVRPQLMALPAEATAAVAAGCACGSEGCPEPPDCQPESPAPPQSPSACVCGSKGCPGPPNCQLESPAPPESPSVCVCGTDGCPELPNCQPKSPALPVSPSACTCGSEGCPEPPNCFSSAAEQPSCTCDTDGCPPPPNCVDPASPVAPAPIQGKAGLSPQFDTLVRARLCPPLFPSCWLRNAMLYVAHVP